MLFQRFVVRNVSEQNFFFAVTQNICYFPFAGIRTSKIYNRRLYDLRCPACKRSKSNYLVSTDPREGHTKAAGNESRTMTERSQITRAHPGTRYEGLAQYCDSKIVCYA